MDAGLITLEGRMIGQNLDMAKHFKLGMDLCIYGRPSHRAVLEPELAWATQAQQGFDSVRRRQPQNEVDARFIGKGRVLGDGSVGGPSATESEDDRRLWDNLKKVEKDAKQSDSLMVSNQSGFLLRAQDDLTADSDVTNLPLHPNPPGIASGQLMVDLLPHQSQALQVRSIDCEADDQWMISHEGPQLPKTSKDAPVQFWARQDTESGSTSGPYWLNIATRTPQKDDPKLGKGGILADGMGLGAFVSATRLMSR
jgi:SWI/SNF-related matrix-associated actin-dependent regulator of chromatin subfamily A3